MHKLRHKTATSAIEERGRARLMLRMPQHRQALAGVSSDRFLDLCEAYELACNALVHWSKSPCAEKAERMEELRAIVAEMELDAAHYAASGDKEKAAPRERDRAFLAGRDVSTWSEEWRNECEIANLAGLAQPKLSVMFANDLR